MAIINPQQQQSIHRNFSLVVDYLESKFRKSPIHLLEVPNYMYQGNKSKLEITVYSNPRIAKVDVKIIGLKDYDREPAYACTYDLNGLSINVFQREIDNLISRMD